MQKDVEKLIGKSYEYNFLAMLLKFCKALAALLRDLFSTGDKRKFMIFFHGIFMLARCYRVLVTDIKSLLVL